MKLPSKFRFAPVYSSVLPSQQAAQDWLPLDDLHSGLLFRPDGAVVGGLSVAPFSLKLKSTTETRSIIGAVKDALNSIDQPWEILSMYRPVDLDTYLTSLDRMLRDTDNRRKPILRDYIAWVTRIVSGGDAVERKYYILIVRTGPEAVHEHRTNLPALAQDLQRARGLQVKVMNDQDWRELLLLSYQADHSATESIPDALGRIPPIYEEIG